MAFSMTNVVTNTVIGDYKVRMFDLNADAATGSVNPGMGRIYAALVGIKSNVAADEPMPRVLENVNPSGVASIGVLSLTGVTAGDTFHVVVFAKG